VPCVSLPRATQDNGKERHLVAVLVFTSKLNLDTEDSRMEKYIFDQSNGLWYELQGDYYIPCLVLDEASTSPIGMWGRKHQQYLKEHRPILYSDLVLSGVLHSYLADIDTQTRNKLHLLVTQLAEKEGINEQLKAQDQMAWVGAMNNIRNRAEEIILQELIYGEDAV
jgi:hypothetical protein